MTSRFSNNNNNNKAAQTGDKKKTPYYSKTVEYKYLTEPVANYSDLSDDDKADYTSSQITGNAKLFCTHGSMELPAKNGNPASTYCYAKVYVEPESGAEGRHQPEVVTPPMKMIFNPEGGKSDDSQNDGVSVQEDKKDDKKEFGSGGKLVLCLAAVALDGQDGRDSLSPEAKAYFDERESDIPEEERSYSASRMQGFIDDMGFFDQHAIRAIINQGQASDEGANWAVPKSTADGLAAVLPKGQKATKEQLINAFAGAAKGSISAPAQTKAGKDVPPLLRARIKLGLNGDIDFSKASIYRLVDGDYVAVTKPADGQKYVHEQLTRGSVLQAILSSPTGSKSGNNLSHFWFATQVLILQEGAGGGQSHSVENKFAKRVHSDSEHQEGPDAKRSKFSV